MITDADALRFDDAMRPWEFPRLNTAAGINAPWVEAFVASQLANVLARLAIGDELTHQAPHVRAWFRLHAEECVIEALLFIEEERKKLHVCQRCGAPLACGADQCFDCWRAQGDGHP